MISMTIATLEDAKELVEIYAPYVLHTAITFETEVPSVEEFQKRIETLSANYPYIVIKDGEQCIGYAYASPFHERAAYGWDVDWSIYIKEEYHGHHLSTILFHALKDLLVASGYLRIYSLVTSANSISMKMHDRLGFTSCGYWKHTGYKHNEWYDVAIYEYVINDTDIPKPVIPFSKLDKEVIQDIIHAYNTQLGEIIL